MYSNITDNTFHEPWHVCQSCHLTREMIFVGSLVFILKSGLSEVRSPVEKFSWARWRGPQCTFLSVHIRQLKQYSSKTSVYRKCLCLQTLSDLVTMISCFNGSKNHILLIIHVFPSYIFDLNLNQRLIQERFCLVILNIS